MSHVTRAQHLFTDGICEPLRQHHNSLRVDKTHDPSGMGLNNFPFYTIPGPQGRPQSWCRGRGRLGTRRTWRRCATCRRCSHPAGSGWLQSPWRQPSQSTTTRNGPGRRRHSSAASASPPRACPGAHFLKVWISITLSFWGTVHWWELISCINTYRYGFHATPFTFYYRLHVTATVLGNQGSVKVSDCHRFSV